MTRVHIIACALTGVLLPPLCARALGAPKGNEQETTDADLGAPRISGKLSFRCEPDDKSKAAGARAFDETLELANDRVTSKRLTGEGFPVALSIPKVVNGIPTFNIVFKKEGAAATYFIRVKRGGAVSGSFTRTEGGKTLRYVIGSTAEHEQPATRPTGPMDKGTLLEPAVLRVNGGFVRLMAVPVAMADAGVNADKTKVSAILKSAGADQNALRLSLLRRQITPEQYAAQGEARIAAGQKALAGLFGPDKSPQVERAMEQPFAATYVYLNQLRAAAVEVGDNDRAKRADHAAYEGLLKLTELAKQKHALTPDAVAKLKDRARTDVAAALGDDKREQFDKTLDALTSYKPEKSD